MTATRELTRDGIIAALSPRVDASAALRDFAGISADTRQSIGRAAEAVSTAAYSGSRFYAGVAEADVRALADFLDFLLGEFPLCGVVRRDNQSDEQHSPDESHHLDRERM